MAAGPSMIGAAVCVGVKLAGYTYAATRLKGAYGLSGDALGVVFNDRLGSKV